MKTSIVRITLLLLIAVLAVAVVGCQSIAEQATEAAVEQATGVKIDKSGDEVTIQGEDGSEVTASSGGELPDGFPADVPVYEGNIIASVKAPEGYSVTIEAASDVATVFDWYKTELDSQGWEIKSEVKVQDGGALSAEKGTQQLQVTFGADSGDATKSTISLITSTK